MKKFKCLLTAMLLACSTASFAQFTNGGGGGGVSSDVEAWKGLRFSYDRTFAKYDDGEDSEDQNYNGFSVGYVQSFKIAKKLPIFFETGLGLNYARWSEEDEYYKEMYDEKVTDAENHLGLTIPLNFVYGVKINDMLTIKPYTGFYLRVNLLAKATRKADNKDLQEFFEEEEMDSQNLFDSVDDGGADYKRCQFGWQIGATLDINKFNVGIGYALDFNEVCEDTMTSKFAVTVGMNF